MSLSIYGAFYNVERMRFDWRGALSNWTAFLQHSRDNQIVLALNTSDDGSAEAMCAWIADYCRANPTGTRIDLVETAISYEDPTFDGQIKAAALAKCDQPFAMLLDADERVTPRQYRMWIKLAHELEQSPYDAFMVPVVDLLGDERHWRSIGTKPYIHKNRPELTRGVRREARLEDGSINTDLSDSTELIVRETGELARMATLVHPAYPPFMVLGVLENGEVPFVYHLGWIDAEQRLRQADMWRPVWTARRGGRNPEPKLTLKDLHEMPRLEHRLPSWKE